MYAKKILQRINRVESGTETSVPEKHVIRSYLKWLSG